MSVIWDRRRRTKPPASENPSHLLPAVACSGIAIATPGALPEPLDTCLPSIEEIEAELGRIGEEESGTLNGEC